MRKYEIDRDIPNDGNWDERVLLYWLEDDATMGIPDHVRPERRHYEIYGSFPKKEDIIKSIDHGDAGYDLYKHGRVIFWACDGGGLGYLIKEVKQWPK